jgi:hypothetical protein
MRAGLSFAKNRVFVPRRDAGHPALRIAILVYSRRKSMRHPTVPFLLGLVLAAAAACADSASRLVAPDNSASILAPSSGPSLTQGGNGNNGGGNNDNNGGGNNDNNGGNGGNYNNDNDDNGDHEWDNRSDDDEVTVCHAYGKDEKRYDKSKYQEIKTTKKGSSAHLDKHGKPKSGHDDDYVEPKGERGCTGTGTISKTLVDVMTTDSKGKMISDPTWTAGGPVTIPKGETRWLFYRIDYALPGGGYGTLSEDKNSVCGTLGAGFYCSFNTGGKYSWSVKGSASKEVQIDITNKSRCDAQDFTNTAVLTPKGGKPVSASAKTTLKLVCQPAITFTKRLTRVSTMSGSLMINDPNWSLGQPVTIPVGETRWVTYTLEYTLPPGVTGTITEDPSVCNTASAGVHCSFNNYGVFSWAVSGTSSMEFTVDLQNNNACGEGNFTNTAVLTPSAGASVTATAPIKLILVCPTVKKTLDRVFTMSGSNMIDDPMWVKGGPVVIPFGETRWLRYVISYTLPSGVAGTITEDPAVCNTASAGVHCGWNNYGVFSWPASGTGTQDVDIDLRNDTGCGNGSFTNTAVMVLATGGSVSATAPTKLILGCKK